MKYLLKKSKHLPLILCGDFNAEPNEMVYKNLSAQLASVYHQHSDIGAIDGEPRFTTWTKRHGERQMKRTLDYIFVRKDSFAINSLLPLDSQELTEPIPNQYYPSDHLSLVAQLTFIDKNH